MERARASASRLREPSHPADLEEARAKAPRRLVRGSSFTSSVTGVEYRWHELAFYRTPGRMIDIWDPYDPYNYWHWIVSPYYGLDYVVADDCPGTETVVPKQDVSFSFDSDGRILATVDTVSSEPPSVTTFQAPSGG